MRYSLSELFGSTSNYGLTSHSGDLIQQCGTGPQPVASYAPCDASLLSLAEKGGKLIKPKVECTDRASRDKTLAAEHIDLLGGDDLLLQVIADYHKDGDYDPTKLKKAEILIEAETRPDCSLHQHPLVEWKGTDGTHERHKTVSIATREVLAQSTRWGSGTGGYLRSLWTFSEQRIETFHANLQSCGVSVAGPPVVRLRGRVEAWPNDEMALSVKFPPLKKKTWSRERSKDTKGTKVDASSVITESDFQQAKKGHEVTKTQKKGEAAPTYEYTEHTKDSAGYFSRKFTIKHDTPNTAEDPVALNKKYNSYVVFHRNGHSLDSNTVLKTFKNILQAYRDITKFIDNIKSSLPKAGFFADANVSILEGELKFVWGVEPRREATHPRIWEIEKYYAIEGSMKVINVDAFVMAGILFEKRGWITGRKYVDVEVGVKLSVAFSLTLNGSLSSANETNKELVLTGKGSAEISAGGHASIFGYAYVARASVAASITAKGELTGSFEKAPEITAEVSAAAIKAIVTFQRARHAKMYYEEFYPWGKEPTVFYKGAVPRETAAPASL